MPIRPVFGCRIFTLSIQGRWGLLPSNSSHPSTASSFNSFFEPTTKKEPSSKVQIGSANPQKRFLEIIQSPILSSHSISRSWPHSGIHWMSPTIFLIWSRQSILMYHSSTIRKTSSSPERQQWGYTWGYCSTWMSKFRFFKSAIILPFVCLSVAHKPVNQPNPSMNLDSSSKGAISTNPWTFPIRLSISPQPGAIWTIPVPSPATTTSFPKLSFPPSITLWQVTPLTFFCSRSGFVNGYPPGIDWASKESKGPSYSQPIISDPFTEPSIVNPPCSLKIWAMVFSFGTPSIHSFFSLNCFSRRWCSRFSEAQ